MKKFLSAILSICMLFSITAGLQINAYAASDNALSKSEAVQFVKGQMLQRQNNIQFNMRYDYDPDKEFDDIMEMVFDEDNANAPNEGDYLLYSNCGWSMKVQSDPDSHICSFSLSPKYCSTAEQEKAVDKAIEKIINDYELLNLSDFDKILTIYNYICSNVAYDFAHYNENYPPSYSCYAALIEKVCVCQGYALTFYRLCKEVGLDARIISNSDHAWNIVNLNGLYYNIDSTWESAGGTQQDPSDYIYFMKCDEHFENHDPDVKFLSKDFTKKYPKAEACYKYKENEELNCSHKWDSVVVNKATLSNNGSIKNTCSICGEIKSSETIYYPKTITLSSTSYTYDSKVKNPRVIVKDCNGNSIASSNYTVSYAKGRKNVGKYAVKITFKGNYSGTKTLYFTIKPKATTISSVNAQSKSFTVKWKKQAAQATGYEIQYSTDKKFKKSVKKATIKKNKTTSATIKKLKGKKKYYVRIRAYKTVNGKKYYSAWSKAKTVTTKK